MITSTITCDICGKAINGTYGGASIDMYRYNTVSTELAVYPPQQTGIYDLCDECRESLVSWMQERKREVGE